MEGYCGSCQKRVRGIKKPISWAAAWCTLWLPYIFYRVIFVHRNKCPVCGCKISRKSVGVKND